MFSNNFFSQISWAVFFSVLGSGSVALADYNPPDAEVPDGSTVANGSRTSCIMEEGNTAFTPLIPLTHLAKGDRQPELAFYVPTTSEYRVDIGLLDSDGEFLEFIEATGTEPGIVSVPVTMILETGRYQIHAGLACDDASQYHTEAIAYFELEALPEAVQTEVADTADAATQSEIYADAGYWLDAFTLADETQRLDLLQQLASLETTEQQANLVAIAEALTMKQTTDVTAHTVP
ncbi:DUF928 domain-containing protein [[Leptolyngbya] sp. PCC 7376]|uniref:DUF928 domain-containing protein n=1 Tax=[Leptolyngbya] sp. PCC 7376 TaxID=111781 RepID=UPI0003125EF1|nr:DUF928 domain-containing protein [[Leptolyngbya] sp. PCC 7376]